MLGGFPLGGLVTDLSTTLTAAMGMDGELSLIARNECSERESTPVCFTVEAGSAPEARMPRFSNTIRIAMGLPI
jgi:hypothetical protein